MNQLPQLQAMGLSLPSPAYLIGMVVFGLIGWVAFRRGRRLKEPLFTWIGLALMLYPYAVGSTWLLYAVGIALCAGLWWGRAEAT